MDDVRTRAPGARRRSRPGAAAPAERRSRWPVRSSRSPRRRRPRDRLHTSWAAPAGQAMTPIDRLGSARASASSETWRTARPADVLADLVRVDVEKGDGAEVLRREPLRVGEGMTEIAHARRSDLPLPIETELVANLAEEEVDVVAGARRAVGTEVRQVLSHLGGVDAGGVGQFGRTRRWGCRQPRARAGRVGTTGSRTTVGSGIRRAKRSAIRSDRNYFVRPLTSAMPRPTDAVRLSRPR